MSPPLSLTQIDALLRREHSHLTLDDEVYFLREYTSGVGYAHSVTNDLISNLKKPVSRRGRPEYGYREAAIRQCARELSSAIHPTFMAQATWVPMPPSRHRNDPEHDDRLRLVLAAIDPPPPDIRELLVMSTSIVASHTTSARPSPAQLAAHMAVDPRLGSPEPSTIALFDDVLTTGAHFRAASLVLGRAFPDAAIVGLCIARRVFP